VGPIFGLDFVGKRKILHSLESNPELPALSLSLHLDYDFLDNIPVSYSGVPRFSLSGSYLHFSLGFHQSLQANDGIVSHIRLY
jgi:hypothetical protein